MADRAFSRPRGAADAGCEATFEALDRYVEAAFRGDDVTATFAALVTHLRNCTACGEDAEGLLAVLAMSGPRPFNRLTDPNLAAGPLAETTREVMAVSP